MRILLLILPCAVFAGCFSVAEAQIELRPVITGSAKSQTTTSTSKIPISTVINEQVDLEVDGGANAPTKKMRALHVTARNRSDAPLIFDGDHCYVSAKNGGQMIARCITQNQMDAIGRPPTTFAGKLSSDFKATVTAAASVGVIQTAETIKREVGPIEKRYEYDRERQVNEESRFGRRLVYPGDSTNGKIYFDINVPLEDGMLLQLPIKSFYDSSAEATLGKPIRITTAGNRQ